MDPSLAMRKKVEMRLKCRKDALITLVSLSYLLTHYNRIKVKSLTGDTDIPNLANSLIDQTKFLTPSRTNELITLLYKLQSRTIDPSSSSQPQDDQDNKTWLKKQLDSLKSPSSIIPLATTASSSSFSHLQSPSSAAQNGPVSIDYIDAYIEDLYEETGPKKLESLRCILELSRTPSLQPFLLSNGT